MEELYTLQVLIETDPTEEQPEAHSVEISAEKESLWLRRLGIDPDVETTKKADDLSGENKLDVLGFVAMDDEEHEAITIKGLSPVSVSAIHYDPADAPGSRLTFTFNTYHLSCLGAALLLVTIGLSHSINR